jgi:hypothetical protein
MVAAEFSKIFLFLVFHITQRAIRQVLRKKLVREDFFLAWIILW